MNPDDWEKVMQVNLNGTFNVTRLAIPHLKKSQAGCIINMSSVAGRIWLPQPESIFDQQMGADWLHENAFN